MVGEIGSLFFDFKMYWMSSNLAKFVVDLMIIVMYYFILFLFFLSLRSCFCVE